MISSDPESRACLRHSISPTALSFPISALHRRHRAVEFKKFLIGIDKTVPTELDVHIVCDNRADPQTVTVRDRLDKHPRFHVHFTPTKSSWVNQVERLFGYLIDQLLPCGVHTLVAALEKDGRGIDRRLERESETLLSGSKPRTRS